MRSQRQVTALVKQGRPHLGRRGVDEPIQQDQDPLLEKPNQMLLHELRSGGRVQECLGARRDRQGGVLHERANPLGHIDPAGLAQQFHPLPSLGELAHKRRGERRLAGAVEPLDRDQPAASNGGTVASLRWPV